MTRIWLRRLLKLTAVGVGAPLMLAVCVYVKWCVVDGKLATITPGSVYQSAAFDADELVDVCRRYGIRSVIDLRDNRPALVAANIAAAREADLQHIHLPTGTYPTADFVDSFLTQIAAAERPVLVHCQHGEGRSVLMCALHRIQNEGWTNEQALAGTCRLPDNLQFLTDWFPSLRRFKETHPKGRTVLRFRRRPATEGAAPAKTEAAAKPCPAPSGSR